MRTNTETSKAWELLQDSIENAPVYSNFKQNHGYWHIALAALLLIPIFIISIAAIKVVLIIAIPSILQLNRTF